MGGGGGGGGGSWKLKKAAKKLFVQTCSGASFCHGQQSNNNVVVLHNSAHVPCDSPNFSYSSENRKRRVSCKKIPSAEIVVRQGNSNTTPSSNNKSMCAICLDPLNYCSASSPGQAIFTAQCSHAFHFSCISSNVRHGSVTCPICRAHWTQLPRNLNTLSSLHFNKKDPALQILDNSIANSRVHRRSSFLHSTTYNNDDPIEPDHSTDQPRLHLSLITAPLTDHRGIFHSSGSSSTAESPNNETYLHVRLAHQPATDIVLVASPNGPHLRLMKHAMALVASSLRPTDRLAIVTYSSAATRVFPFRRMTSYGKRSALQIINRLFYMGQVDPIEGLKKGVKVLEDRVHNNPHSCLLHLTDSLSRSYHQFDAEVPHVTIHRFHVGLGFDASNGFVRHEFEEFLARTLGGAVRDVQLRIAERAGTMMIGELRGGEERNIPLYLGDSGHVCVEYSYVDGECIRTGEIVIGTEEGNECSDGVSIQGRRMNNAESWDYHDSLMARRWAKHLHGYRL